MEFEVQPLLLDECKYIDINNPERDTQDEFFNTRNNIQQKIDVLMRQNGNIQKDPAMLEHLKTMQKTIQIIDDNLLLQRVSLPEKEVAVGKIAFVDGQVMRERMNLISNILNRPDIQSDHRDMILDHLRKSGIGYDDEEEPTTTTILTKQPVPLADVTTPAQQQPPMTPRLVVTPPATVKPRSSSPAVIQVETAALTTASGSNNYNRNLSGGSSSSSTDSSSSIPVSPSTSKDVMLKHPAIPAI